MGNADALRRSRPVIVWCDIRDCPMRASYSGVDPYGLTVYFCERHAEIRAVAPLRPAQDHQQGEEGDHADLDEQRDDLGVRPHVNAYTQAGPSSHASSRPTPPDSRSVP